MSYDKLNNPYYIKFRNEYLKKFNRNIRCRLYNITFYILIILIKFKIYYKDYYIIYYFYEICIYFN